MKSWSRPDWLIVILFVALVTLFYWRILTPDLADRQSFPPGDFSTQFWAFTTFEARELSQGRLPLWNPYTFAGAPFWADVQAAVFYPPSLLTLLFSAPWGFSLFALEIEAIAHFWLAATFMYLFIRQITHSRPAALIAALTFTFSGYLTGYPSQQLAVLEVNVWLPLILFFIHRAYEQWKVGRLEDRKSGEKEQSPTLNISKFQALRGSVTPERRSLLLAGVAWGLALLAGHPQSALIVAYISTAYFFFLSLTTVRHTHPLSHKTTPHPSSLILHPLPFAHWLVFILTGLALAAIQFIPAVEYTLLSVRAEGTYDKMSGGFPITDVIQFLLPGQVSFYSPLYVGIVGLILALWITFAQRSAFARTPGASARTPGTFAQVSRHITFWAIIAFITLLISFGGNTFLYSPLYLFTPGFSIFRGQERWAFAVAFSLSVLAGYGFKAISTTHYPPRTTHYVLRFTQYLLLFALLLTFLFFYGLNDTGWTPDSPFYNLLGGATLLTLLLALAWLLWKFSARLHPFIFTGLAAALVCLDLFTANWQTNLYPELPEWHTRRPDIVAAIKKDATESPAEPYRVYNEFRLYDNYGVPFEIENLGGASPLRPNRYDRFLAPPMPIERAWELLNVKYVITWREELYVPSTIIYQEPADDGATYVHRLNQVGPRAWLVTQAEIANDAAILQKIADPNFDRWHIALLEPNAEPYIKQINESTNDETTRKTQYVTRNTFHASHLTYHITTPTPALLILSETHYPGWQAAVDDQPAPLLRADYVLRAVPLPAGEHTVELTFRPLTFTIGAVISVVALLVTIAFILTYRRKGLS